MRYLPPFELLKSYMTIQTSGGQRTASCTYEQFVEMIRRLIVGIRVDADWYKTRYPDIAEAVDRGEALSPQKHFVGDGYFEGRLPFEIKVDERYYLISNPDIAESIQRGLATDAQQHFAENGYQEGRLPFGL